MRRNEKREPNAAMRFLFQAFILLVLCRAIPCAAGVSMSPEPPLGQGYSVPDGEILTLAGQGASDTDPLHSDDPRVLIAQAAGPTEVEGQPGEPAETEQPQGEIADPLEPVNRGFYHFNDKLYFWVLKPVATTYQKALPEPLRASFRNLFYNIATPVRVVNCFLQLDFEGVGTEIFRLVVNSTMGVFGFGDPGKEVFGIDRRNTDLGETFGVYGLGPAFYIDWPFFGPSSLRDSAGMAGDYFLDPLAYLYLWYEVGAKGFDRVNRVSLTLGDYEALKRAALDPYVAIRNAYYQYRESGIKKAKKRSLIP